MRRFSVGTLLVAVLFAAGCGGGGGGTQPSSEATNAPEQVVADAVKAAEAATSVHISGQVVRGDQQLGVDLTLVRGKGATGSMTLGGAKVDLVVVGGTAYMRGGLAFWHRFGHAPGVAQILANKWLKFSSNNKQLGSLTGQVNAKSLLKSLSTNHGKLANHGEKTYKG